MIWIFIIYVLVGIIVAIRNKDDIGLDEGSNLHYWIGALWPLFLLFLGLLFLLDLVGFRIH